MAYFDDEVANHTHTAMTEVSKILNLVPTSLTVSEVLILGDSIRRSMRALSDLSQATRKIFEKRLDT